MLILLFKNYLKIYFEVPNIFVVHQDHYEAIQPGKNDDFWRSVYSVGLGIGLLLASILALKPVDFFSIAKFDNIVFGF